MRRTRMAVVAVAVALGALALPATASGWRSQYKLSFSAAVVWNTNGVSGCSDGGSAYRVVGQPHVRLRR